MAKEIGVLRIESPAFGNHQTIPSKYTCEGEDRSPPLTISSHAIEAVSFAIIVEDPDAPVGVFDHWLGWNIPAGQMSLPEGYQAPLEGINGFGKIGYKGPCPPRGKPHRYYFRIFALDQKLALASGSSKSELLRAMEGHILAKGELMGTYQR